jgi:hypothetical protein
MAAFANTRTGLTAVRKITDVSALAIQSLEEDITRMVTFFAAAFHQWRENAIIQRLARLLQQESEAQAQKWEQYKDRLRKESEGILNKFAQRDLMQKAKVAQAMFAGNAQVMKRTTFLAWQALRAAHSAKSRKGAAVEMAMAKFLGGATKGLKQVVYKRWSEIVQELRLEKMKAGGAAALAEAERLAAEREAKMRQQHEDLMNRSKNNVTIACKKWFSKGATAVMKTVWSAWYGVVEKKKKAKGHSDRVKKRMAIAMDGEAAFLKQAFFQQMKADWELAKHTRASEEELQKQMLAAHADRDKLLNEAQAAKSRQKQATQEAMNKFLLGETKGLIISAFKAWRQYTKELEERKTNSKHVQAALLRSFGNEKIGLMKMCSQEWHSLVQKGKAKKGVQKVVAQMLLGKTKGLLLSSFKAWQGEARANKQATSREEEIRLEMEKKLAALMQERDDAEGRAGDAKANGRDKLLANVQNTLRQWLGNLQASIFSSWKVFSEKARRKRRQSKSVQVTMERFLLGEKRAIIKNVFLSWSNLIKMMKEHKSEMGALENSNKKLREQNLKNITKSMVALVGTSGPLLMQMYFVAWKEAANPRLAAMSQRDKDMAMQEMERNKKIEHDEKQVKIANALIGLGGGGKVMVQKAFLAWSVLVQKSKAQREHKLHESKVLRELAEKMIVKNMVADAGTLLNYCFHAWIKGAHRAMTEGAREECRLIKEQLEQRIAGLEEELVQAYTQIDHIAETLQSELQSKEDLVSELRNAHSGARKRSQSSPKRENGTRGASSSTPLDRSLDTSVSSAGRLPYDYGDHTPSQSLGHASTITGGRSRSYTSLPASGAEVSPIQPARSRPVARKKATEKATNRSPSGRSGSPDSDGSSRFRIVQRLEPRRHDLAMWQALDMMDPPNCDWDHLVEQMHEEGILKADLPRGF